MATRFVLHSNGSSGIAAARNATLDGNWNLFTATGSMENNLLMRQNWLGTANVEAFITGTATNPELHLVRRFISKPLVAQTMPSGTTLKGQIRVRESATTVNATLAICAKIVNNAADGLRFHMIGPDPVTTDDLINYEFPSVASAALALNQAFLDINESPNIDCGSGGSILTGDRILLDIGYMDRSTGTSTNGRLEFCDDGAAWLAEALRGDATANNPWVEFSYNFQFQVEEMQMLPEFPNIIYPDWGPVGY